MAKGNKGLLRLIRDEQSKSGLAAAILLRNVRPRKSQNGTMLLAHSDFTSNFAINFDGFRVKPRVIATVQCQLSQSQAESLRKRKRLDRAMAGSPMLK